MNIWIDITNAPHVVIFKPLIAELKKRGCEVTVTAREFSQTVPMLKKHNIDFTLIGKHRGKNVFKKALGLFSRTFELVRFARPKKFDLAVSHASNDLAVASFILRIPHVTMFDYEFATVSHHVNLRLSKKILFPDIIAKSSLYRFGASDDRMDPYPGLKEEYYLNGFLPNKEVVSQLGLDTSKVIVTMRTPPELALYHRFENPLFKQVIEHLSRQPEVLMVVLPRTKEQAEDLKKLGVSNLIVPDSPVDAQSLIYYSDLVVGAGGTMNREAVVLGTPVYSIFAGKIGAIDKHLIEMEKMFALKSPSEIVLKKKEAQPKIFLRDPAVIVEKILEAVT